MSTKSGELMSQERSDRGHKIMKYIKILVYVRFVKTKVVSKSKVLLNPQKCVHGKAAFCLNPSSVIYYEVH